MKIVTLIKPHRHAGKSYQPNDVLKLSDRDADWLVEKKVARLGGTLPAAPSAPAESEK